MSGTNQSHDTRTHNQQQSGQHGINAAHEGAGATQESGRATAEAMREAGQAAARVGARMGETSAEMMRRNTGAMAETHREITKEAAERMEEATRNIAEAQRSTAEDMKTFMQLPTAAEGGLKDLHQSMASLVEGVVQTNLRATEELAKLTNPAGFIELQHRFMRDYMAALLEGTAMITRAIRQTAEQSLPPIEQHLRDKQAQEAQRGTAQQKGYQRQSAAE